jgi:hypothetical protein
MTGISQIVVGMWFLPVTLFIIIPLVMFVVWHLGLRWACRKTLFGKITRGRRKDETDPRLFSTT